MFGVVIVHFDVGTDAGPFEDGGPFDAVGGLAGDGGNGADGDGGAGGEHVEGAFVAGGDFGDDDAGLTFEAFGTAVNEGLTAVGIVPVYETDKGSIDPTTGFDRIETANDAVEGHVKGSVFVLNGAKVGGYRDIGDSRLDKAGGADGFWLADIGAAKEKLTVEV